MNRLAGLIRSVRKVRRLAALAELHSLGVSNSEAAELLGVNKVVICQDAAILGIRFMTKRDRRAQHENSGNEASA